MALNEFIIIIIYLLLLSTEAEDIHDMITRDLECPWHDNCIICSHDITRADLENSLYAFGQSEKS